MGIPWIHRSKSVNKFRTAITKSADKYTWPPVAPVIYDDGIELRQVSDRVFMLIGLVEVQTRHKDFLLKQLKRTAPVDTGALRRSYDVFPLEYQKGQWALIINNSMTYFKFAYHFYRGEIAQNRKFIMDFIKDAVDPVVRKMGKKPPKLPSSGLESAKQKIPQGIVNKTDIKKEIKDVKLPKLAEGKKYGAPIIESEVKVGDRFLFRGDRARGSTGGKIVKVNPKTIEYETSFMGKPMKIKTRKEDVFKPGLTFITKGSSPNTVHPIQ